MRYEEYLPPPSLADHVLSLWSFQRPAGGADALQHHVPPDGCMSLAFVARPGEPPNAILIGAHDSPLVVPILPGDRYWGIRFWPDAGAACLGVDAAAWVGRVGPALPLLRDAPAALFRLFASAPADAEVERALGEWALAHGWEATALDVAVRLAVIAIVASRGAISMRELPGTVGLSSRTLLRRFRAATGLTFKRYAKVRRFREAASQHFQSPESTWSRIAADVGYADHAHLTREFRAIHGAPPSAVVRLIARISHGAIRP